MTGKGAESQRQWSRRSYLVRTGRAEPVQYNLSVEEAIKATGTQTFTSTEIGKKINESARTTSHFLALTTGVLLQGFGVYEFTGETIEVDA